MHEVITLQFGQQANYIGTHYWNTQESYFTYPGQEDSPVDHDVSFRAGIGANGEDTYTPRTLIYDLKGAFGTLRRENALYELQQQDEARLQGPWTGATTPFRLPTISQSPYQQALDQGLHPPRLTTETVRFWSDYNHLFYHPRSIVQLNEYELNSSIMPFERWENGEELFTNLDREQDLLDRDLRPFLEECDQLQGLQILTGIDDAWGGFAARYLERIADELGKGCRWVFGLSDEKRASRERQMLQLVNTAKSICAIDAAASLHLPLTSAPKSLPEYVSLGEESRWQTSALQVALVESVTLPTRLRQVEGSGRATFDALETTLNNDGNRRLGETCLSAAERGEPSDTMEIDGRRDGRLPNGHPNDVGHDHGDARDLNFFPHLAVSTARARHSGAGHAHTFSVVEVFRGAWGPGHQGPDSEHGIDGTRRSEYLAAIEFPVLPSYPTIFHFESNTTKLAVKASVSTTTATVTQVRGLEHVVRRMISIDEREALCDSLLRIADEYEEGWDEDGEDDDD